MKPEDLHLGEKDIFKGIIIKPDVRFKSGDTPDHLTETSSDESIFSEGNIRNVKVDMNIDKVRNIKAIPMRGVYDLAR